MLKEGCDALVSNPELVNQGQDNGGIGQSTVGNKKRQVEVSTAKQSRKRVLQEVANIPRDCPPELEIENMRDDELVSVSESESMMDWRL